MHSYIELSNVVLPTCRNQCMLGVPRLVALLNPRPCQEQLEWGVLQVRRDNPEHQQRAKGEQRETASEKREGTTHRRTRMHIPPFLLSRALLCIQLHALAMRCAVTAVNMERERACAREGVRGGAAMQLPLPLSRQIIIQTRANAHAHANAHAYIMCLHYSYRWRVSGRGFCTRKFNSKHSCRRYFGHVA